MESCKTWNEEMTREFSLYKPVMWLIGSWPLDRSKKFAKYRALFYTVIQAIFVTWLFIEIYHNNALNMVIDYLVLATCSILSVIKLLVIRLYRDNLLKNLYNAASDWMYIAKQDHRQVMFHYTNLGRFVFFFLIYSPYVIIIPATLSPFLLSMMPSPVQNITLSASSEKEMQAMELPFKMTCPFDTKNACLGIYLLQTIQINSLTLSYIGSDVFLFGACMHLCGQLEVLSLELLRFRKETKKELTIIKMIMLIERHCLLLNLAKDIVNILCVILVSQLVADASLICLLAIELIELLRIGNYILSVRSIIAFNLLMFGLFLYSYMGESLSSRTQEISNAIYFSKWYDLPTKIVRDLSFIISRANMTVSVKVGNFYNMDLNSFKNILKTSASYFSILRIILTQ